MSDDRARSRRPANTAFKQQRLKAWQPLLTPKSVLPTLFVLGVIFAPLGAFLLHTSNSVTELIVDYTDCASAPSNALGEPNKVVTSLSAPGVTSGSSALNFKWQYRANSTANECLVEFTLPVTMQKPVFLYYRLTNFYQNHRRYVKSFDAGQLKGSPPPVSTIKSNCLPLGAPAGASEETVYYPCGLIANSMFNDSISDPVTPDGARTYKFSPKGIAWPADASKYGPFPGFNPDIHLPPPNWAKRYPNGKYVTAPDLANNERFQVWMRTAGLPNFRKLYGRNDDDDLTAGTYRMTISDDFEVKSYGGTKSIVISTVSFMGGKNPFLGYAYIVVGAVCIILAVVFAARHLYAPRKLGDHRYLSWNHQPPPSTNQQQ